MRSSGNKITFNRFPSSASVGGYGGSTVDCNPLPSLLKAFGETVGGIVLAGLGDVNAKMRAVAEGSAKVLNSATGVAFPGTEIAPPMTRTDLARMRIFGECDAARARFVRGPMAMIVIVPGGFSARILMISRYEA